jgi:hypothetical protein
MAQIINPIMTRAMTPSIIHPNISITIIVQIIFPLNKVLGTWKIPQIFKGCCKGDINKKVQKIRTKDKKIIKR